MAKSKESSIDILFEKALQSLVLGVMALDPQVITSAETKAIYLDKMKTALGFAVLGAGLERHFNIAALGITDDFLRERLTNLPKINGKMETRIREKLNEH